MDALILAGGIPKPNDLLYDLTQGQPKSLLEINGRSLIQHVLSALQNAPSIDDILIIGLENEEIPILPPNIYALPDQGGLVQNGMTGLQWLKKHRGKGGHVAIVNADIPLLTPEITEQVIANCQPLKHMLYYHFVTREVLEDRFPNSKRTYTKFKEVEVSGGDFMVAHTRFAEDNEALYEMVTNGRKHPWKIARLVGIRFLLKFLFRQVTIADVERLGSQTVNMPVKVVLSPFAEIAMDIDKPTHLKSIQTHYKKL